MTMREIDIVCDDDELYDLFLYIYCLRRSPEQVRGVYHVSSEIKQAEKNLIEQVNLRKKRFD